MYYSEDNICHHNHHQEIHVGIEKLGHRILIKWAFSIQIFINSWNLLFDKSQGL